MFKRTLIISAALAVAAVAVSCKAGGPESPYTALGADANALRAKFNADVGKVRVVMLVAPT